MAKKTKGYAKGGMAKGTKGYARGGAAKSTKSYTKGAKAPKTALYLTEAGKALKYGNKKKPLPPRATSKRKK